MAHGPLGYARAVSAPPVLSADALNRATLARQLLLERSPLDPVSAVAALGGLQAQEPASPFLALHARLETLDPAAVRKAFDDRRLVKATLLRGTLHATTATDYRSIQPAVAALLEGTGARTRGERPDPERLMRLREATIQHAATPRRSSDLRDHVAALEPGGDGSPDDTWWWVRRHLALVHAPGRGPWAFDRRPHLVTAASWLGGDPSMTEDEALVHLVRTHLRAFGPASVADTASWSRITVGRLRPAFATLETEGVLVHLHDEGGRALLDLRDAPRPDPATPAPARLLPMWDSVLLAHADRTRVISNADRALVVDVNGDTYPTFLVDGRVAGLWWARDTSVGTTIDLEPFRPLRQADRLSLESEAERLAAFVAPLEPDVYRRYRVGRDRRQDRRQRDHRQPLP